MRTRLRYLIFNETAEIRGEERRLHGARLEPTGNEPVVTNYFVARKYRKCTRVGSNASLDVALSVKNDLSRDVPSRFYVRSCNHGGKKGGRIFKFFKRSKVKMHSLRTN